MWILNRSAELPRAMNAKFMYLRDSYYKDVSLNDKADNGWGFEWDWMVTDNVGLFVLLSAGFEWNGGGIFRGALVKTGDFAAQAFGCFDKLLVHDLVPGIGQRALHIRDRLDPRQAKNSRNGQDRRAAIGDP